jgi:decaprenylphospho-beta-D-erythro-pentofuranosid-2-ulose 2-reductase
VIDSLGAPESVLVLGGTSEIGTALIEQFRTSGRLRRVVLAARPSALRDQLSSRLAGQLAEVRTVDFDATDLDRIGETMRACLDDADIDVVVIAAGVLPDNEEALRRPAVAVEAAQVNYVAAMAALLHAADALRRQGHGVLVVLSSVAAERPRAANFVYGSTKAGLDSVSRGLAEQLRGSGVTLLTVRPGFVRTRMTAGMAPAPFSTDPTTVARAIAENLRGPSRVIWVPGLLRWVMLALRAMPAAVFRRLPQ